MRHLGKIILASLLFVVPFTVAAQEAQPRIFRPFAVTVAPAYLLFPVYQVTAEYMPNSKLGLALMGGYGGFNGSDFGFTYDYNVADVGGQVRYYPLISHGLMVGGEALWVDVFQSDDASPSGGTGLLVGPFVGYKYVTSFGLTFDSQVGFGFFTLSTSVGSENVFENNSGFPILNLNVGWSFGGK